MKTKGLPVQCGICRFHCREKIFEDKCSAQGKLPTAKGCSSFQPDSYQLASEDPHHSDLEMIASVMDKLSPNQLTLLSSLVYRDRETRRNGFQFYQEVYFRYAGTSSDNYLSNFVKARVLDADKEFVRLIGSDERVRMYLVVENKNASLYKPKEFAVLRKQMLADKKLRDPSLDRQLTKMSKTGAVADIDDAFEQDKLPKKNVRQRSKNQDDLISMTAKLSRGYYGKPRTPYGETIEIHHAHE